MRDSIQYIITTTDNPYDPRDDESFAKWFEWDTVHGYASLQTLAKLIPNLDGLPPSIQNVITNNVIEEFCETNVSGVHTFLLYNESGTYKDLE